MTLLTDLETKIGIADANLDLLKSAVNDAPGTFTVEDGTNVPNLRQRLQDAAYAVPVAFASGLTPPDGSFTVTYEGAVYAADPSALPFTTTSTFDPAQWVLVNRIVFNTVSEMVLSASPSRGIGAIWETKDFKYVELDPSDPDPDFTTSGGVKLNYDPGPGFYYPRAILAFNPPLVVAYPATDQSERIQRALDKCAEGNKRIDFEHYLWRSERTLHRRKRTNSKEVKVVRGSGANIFFPVAGVYDRFRLDDDSGDATDTMRVAFDTSGESLNFEGQLTFRGGQYTKFTSAERALVRQDLACFGGVYSYTAEMNSSGQVSVEAFAHWRYVPDTDTNFSSRQMARTIGQYEVRFCLSPFGYYGSGANGSDDSGMDLHVARVGHHGAVNSTNINGSELNFRYLFATGLRQDPAGFEDWETSTMSVSHNSAIVPMSDTHPHLAAGHFITILNASEKLDEDGNTILMPLTARVQSVSGTTVTLDGDTLPNLPTTSSGSGLRWIYRPPLFEMDNSYLTAITAYFEGHWHGIRMNDNNHISCSGHMRAGGQIMSGLGYALIHTTGFNNNISFTAHDALVESRGLRRIVAYGMISETSTDTDAGVTVDITVKRPKGDPKLTVAPVEGFIPPLFFGGTGPDPRAADLTRRHTGAYASVKYIGAVTEGFIDSGGVFVETREATGFENRLGYKTRFGTEFKSTAVTTTPTTIYSDAELEPLSTYLLAISNGSRNATGGTAFFGVDESGDITIFNQSTTGVTISASGTNLQAARTSGSGQVVHRLIPLV